MHCHATDGPPHPPPPPPPPDHPYREQRTCPPGSSVAVPLDTDGRTVPPNHMPQCARIMQRCHKQSLDTMHNAVSPEAVPLNTEGSPFTISAWIMQWHLPKAVPLGRFGGLNIQLRTKITATPTLCQITPIFA